ncbi:T9SS type A sorting domain-containing protein [Gillisia sp. M10.2A]|uniref:T9SS type A sorting domain-containing protein n=1 Tax=Gillisia lutea TaxID=2909668 RepID=A0ABS9EGG2_9FLAO|nr:T9SS type A sorting domain-containing protein [Gillisia lutea]MCF4101946.1 T9SS type A sorting domain-containing protein [Gillisia lutea]
MGNLFKLSILALMLTASFNVKAAEGLDVRINEETLFVEVQNSFMNASLTLKDEEGNLIFKDGLIDNKSYKKTLNFGTAQIGTYYLNFENEFYIFKKVIHRLNKGVKIDKEASEIIFKPTYKISERKLMFSLTNPEEKMTQIEVYDVRGELVNSITSNDLIIKKTFDFKRVPKGEYLVKIKRGQQVFTKTMNLI